MSDTSPSGRRRAARKAHATSASVATTLAGGEAATSVKDVDIAVVGAGAVGIAAAIAFARNGYSTALIGPIAPREDGRTVALLDGSVRFLRRLDVWETLAPHASPLAVMRIVDDTGSLFRTPPVAFHASEIGLHAFGYNIENSILVKSLGEHAQKQNHLTLIPDMVASLTAGDSLATLTCTSGQHVRARLVIAADGRESPMRATTGIPTKTWAYEQTALTAILAHGKPHGDVSTEFHTRHGPCTLVPLRNGRSSLVWMTTPDHAANLMKLDDSQFAQSVEKQTKSILGEMCVAGPRGAVPMGGLSVSDFASGRVALIGEAAHAFPPIGAQGLNLGLRDVGALLKAVLDGGAEPGAPATMAAYNRSRQRDVRVRTAGVDALNRSLLAPLLPVDLARGIGLVALDLIGPLRRAVMRAGLAASIDEPV